VVVFGSEAQKRRMLPPLIDGTDRACFGVTEPNVGSDTTRVRTFARRAGDRYIVNGQKVWTSTAQHANKILLVARTTPIEECARPMDGVTLFYTDLDRHACAHQRDREDGAQGRRLERTVHRRARDPGRRSHRRGRPGVQCLLHGLNPERILVAASALGAGETALKRATDYAKERVVFGRPIGKNQAIQHPLAECWMRLQSAELLMWKAAALYDSGKPCGVEATAAKYLAAEAGFETALRAVRTHGGFGYAKEYHVERGLRESVLSLLAPVTQELALFWRVRHEDEQTRAMLILLASLAAPLAANAWERGKVETFATLPPGEAHPEGITVDREGTCTSSPWRRTNQDERGNAAGVRPAGQAPAHCRIKGSSRLLLDLGFHPRTGQLLVVDYKDGKVLSVDPKTGASSVFMTVTGKNPGLDGMTFDPPETST
jgi:acyl-CoA dehydrogenase